jgi:hypothetical protein
MLALAPSHVQAMQEAAKHLAKSRTADTAQLAALQEASDRISRFVQAHSLIEQDPAAAVSLCQQLLQEAPEQVVSTRGALAQLLQLPRKLCGDGVHEANILAVSFCKLLSHCL